MHVIGILPTGCSTNTVVIYSYIYQYNQNKVNHVHGVGDMDFDHTSQDLALRSQTLLGKCPAKPVQIQAVLCQLR